MVDRWFGHLLDTLDRLAVWEDTAVIVTTDHGHDLGERQQFGKAFPHLDSHANIPLLIYHPAFTGSRVIDTFTSTVDIYSTILDILDVPHSIPEHSRSMLPLLDGSQSKIREAVLYGIFGKGPCCTDGEYCLFQGFDNLHHPLYSYTGRMTNASKLAEQATSGFFIPNVPVPVWKIPISNGQQSPSMLVAKTDPIGQEKNLIAQEPGIAKRMRELLVELMKEEGCPPEQFARVGLSKREG
jgi:hypothetical protein